VQTQSGQLGVNLVLSTDDARKLSSPSVGTLFGGTYKLIRLAAGAATASARGMLAFWDTSVGDNLYQVTNNETSNGGVVLIAGVFLNTITQGNYGWIQVAGKASCKCRATVTAATRYIIWAGAGAGADNALVDGLATGATFATAQLNNFIGIGEAVAANGATIAVDLEPGVVRQ